MMRVVDGECRRRREAAWRREAAGRRVLPRTGVWVWENPYSASRGAGQPLMCAWVGSLAILMLTGCQSPNGRHSGFEPTKTPIAAASPRIVSYDTPNLPMTERLKLIAQTTDPSQLMFLNRQRSDNLRAQLEGQT